MSKFCNFINKLKTPGKLFSIIYSIFALIVIAFTITMVCLGYTNSIFAYVLYAMSTFALTYLVYITVYYIPKIKELIIKSLKKHKFTNEMLESYGYRSLIFAFCSFTINVLYAIFQAVFAILSQSIWYGALATYYIALSLIRGYILIKQRKIKDVQDIQKEKMQLKLYTNTGIFLILLNFALTGAVVQMVLSNQGFEYAGLMIYAMATFAFYKFGMSIYNIIKAQKQKDYIIKSVKNISFADSLVSILALQTALLQAFSTAYDNSLYNAITGGVVSVLIIVLASIMIINGNKKQQQIQKEKNNESKI